MSTIIIALIAGLVIAFVVTMGFKGQLNNVRSKSGASDYMKTGSLNVTLSRDTFLFSNVSRIAKPKNNASGRKK